MLKSVCFGSFSIIQLQYSPMAVPGREPSIHVAEICTNPIAANWSGAVPRLLWWRIGGFGQ